MKFHNILFLNEVFSLIKKTFLTKAVESGNVEIVHLLLNNPKTDVNETIILNYKYL